MRPPKVRQFVENAERLKLPLDMRLKDGTEIQGAVQRIERECVLVAGVFVRFTDVSGVWFVL